MKRFALFAALSLFAAAGTSAEPVKDKPQIVLDPAQAYVMYAGAHWGQTLTIVSIPTSGEMATYEQDRSTALAQAKRDYAQHLAAWNARKTGSTEPMPVEPTDATFSFPKPIHAVTMGIFSRFAKTDQHSIYLESLPPGDYYIDGPIFNGTVDAVQATCMCLGTVRFHVSAGQITNMGRIVSNYGEAKQRAKAAGLPRPDLLDLPEGVTSMGIEQAVSGAPVDSRIGTFPVKPAEYHPFGKIPNTTGELVDRLTAMPGVFRYERDEMIDLTVGGEK